MEVVVGREELDVAKASAAWKMPEIWNPVSVASWSVVVAARPEKPRS